MSLFKRKILNLIGDRLMTQARVADVIEVSKNFRFIDLESEAFKNIKFNPGEKIQINIGDWQMRTYTPHSLDQELGRLGILAYINGQGPGSKWVSTVKSGDACQIFGPRTSLRLPMKTSSLLLLGDETTIAMAASLRHQFSYSETKYIIEANDPQEVQSVIQDLGLQNVEVFLKSSANTISEEVFQSLHQKALKCEQVLLVGKAESIQHLRGKLKTAGLPLSKIRTKVYWSEGKVGLD